MGRPKQQEATLGHMIPGLNSSEWPGRPVPESKEVSDIDSRARLNHSNARRDNAE
jgi:hypothetical protein